MARPDALAEILAGLRSLVAELKTDAVGDDGIPVLTAAVARPEAPPATALAVGAPVPILSQVAARPAHPDQIEAFAESQGRALQAQLLADQVVRRLTRIWRDAGHDPLDPAMIAALEKALVQALQND